MFNEFTILGANISAISTAIAIKERCPDAKITIFDTRIWNKPCGAAISLEFLAHLWDEYFDDLGIVLPYKFGTCLILGSFKKRITIYKTKLEFGQHQGIPDYSPFVTTSRYDLQKYLLTVLKMKYDIDVIFKNITEKDVDLFTPQTIVATGYSGLSHSLLQRNWDKKDRAILFRYDGVFLTESDPDLLWDKPHIIALDNDYIGYGWYFPYISGHANIGYGLMGNTSEGVSSKDVKKRFKDFLDVLNHTYGFQIPEYRKTEILRKSQGWGVPLPIQKWKIKPCHIKMYGHNGKTVEFIGVGDTIGMAHPVIAAGIEPAWLSGQLIGKSIDNNEINGEKVYYINTETYRNLLWEHQRKLVMVGSDYYVAKMFRSTLLNKIPHIIKNRMFNYIFKRHGRKMLKKWQQHPLFKPFED